MRAPLKTISEYGAIVLLVGTLASCTTTPATSPPTGRKLSTAVADPARFVDPFIGTFGNGNVFPGAVVPFGMVQWSPDTGPSGITRPGGYFYRDQHITGFPLTHLSGAGCVQYDDVPFMPFTRPVVTSPDAGDYPYSARFSHTTERASPGYYAVGLDSGIRVELSAEPHSGVARFTYPSAGSMRLLINSAGSAGPTSNANEATDASIHLVSNRSLEGFAVGGHFCGLSNAYTVYFAAEFDHPIREVGAWRGAAVFPGARLARGPRTGLWVGFGGVQRVVTAHVGLSFVSAANALSNVRAEQSDASFSDVARRARSAWNAALGAIRVNGGKPSQRTVFYTALYHALLHPNIFSDVNGQYDGFDGQLHVAGRQEQYANFSGWDIYRCQVPLLALIEPERTSAMMESLVRDAVQGGWLPRWPVANTDTGTMNGDPADPIISSAYAFGARDFDVHSALGAMIRDGTMAGLGKGNVLARPGLAEYLRLGYLPPLPGAYGSAATTLEYTTDDFATARLATDLGDKKDARLFAARAGGWRHLVNPMTRFIEPVAADGTWPQTFQPTGQDGFVEGDAWQYTWMVPYDLRDLFQLLGGRPQAVHRLDNLFLHLNTDPGAPYYWAGNEPGLETPWEYDFAGAPWRTQSVVRQIMSLYPAATYGIPGNDDLGSLSAWYVWASLGMYPEIPGVGGVAVAAPAFRSIDVRRPRGVLHIEAPGASKGDAFIRSLKVDGRSWHRSWLPASLLAAGHQLTFRLEASADLPVRHWMNASGPSYP